jgi:hypothetical protein
MDCWLINCVFIDKAGLTRTFVITLDNLQKQRLHQIEIFPFSFLKPFVWKVLLICYYVDHAQLKEKEIMKILLQQ